LTPERFVAVAALAAATLAARPAAAYVRTEVVPRSSAGSPTGPPVPVAWAGDCIFMTAFPNDFVAAANDNFMTLEDVQAAVNLAAQAWSMADPMNGCTYLSFDLNFASDPTPRVVHTDYKTMLVFRTTSWCALDPTGQCDPDPGVEAAYDSSALALTTVSANPHTGEIKDVDMEVNAFQHAWADIVVHPELGPAQMPGSTIQDLQNALTHEFGHLIGLDHTCYQTPPATIPTDENGVPILDCFSADEAVHETTMFPSATPGDTMKRDLAPDDRQGLCDIYNVANDPQVCAPVTMPSAGGCSCAAAPGGHSTSALAGGALLAVAVAVRRRRRGARR
jgi:MYXO-CTERM domain-containing protein